MSKRSKTRHLGSPGSQNSFGRHLGSAKGHPEAHKGGLEEPKRSHRGCLETPLGSLQAAWADAGTCLEDPKAPFWSKTDPKLDDFAANLFGACFFEAS